MSGSKQNWLCAADGTVTIKIDGEVVHTEQVEEGDLVEVTHERD